MELQFVIKFTKKKMEFILEFGMQETFLMKAKVLLFFLEGVSFE